MADEPAIIGVAQPETTALQRVRELCDKHSCDPSLRVETFDGTVHFSLMATDRETQKRVYDLRQSCACDDASRDPEAMAAQALREWWA